MIHLNSNIKYLADKYKIFICEQFEKNINDEIKKLKEICSESFSNSSILESEQYKAIKNKLNINNVKQLFGIPIPSEFNKIKKTIQKIKSMKNQKLKLKQIFEQKSLELNNLKKIIKQMIEQKSTELNKLKQIIKQKSTELNKIKIEINNDVLYEQKSKELDNLYEKINALKYYIYDNISNTKKDNLSKLKLINKIFNEINVCVVIKDNKIENIIKLENKYNESFGIVSSSNQ